MLFWIVSGAILFAVTAALMGALRAGRRPDAVSPAASDIAVYRDQLAEVDRDLARGALTEAEAEAVRIEVSRRLLDADKRGETRTDTRTGAFGLGLVLTVVIVALGGIGTYYWIGAPGYADQPLLDRHARAAEALASRPSQVEAETRAAEFLPPAPQPTPEFLELIERLRAVIEERPDDVQGLTLLAQNEARLGNYGAAREAQQRLVEVQGVQAPLQERIALLDLMVFTAGGIVTPEAEAELNKLAVLEPDLGPVRYYRGLLAAQTGRPDIAFPIWRRLLETSTEDAPWVPVIRSEIRAVAAAAGVDYTPPAPSRGPSSADIAAASEMSPEDREEMIRGMVSGLADRLATDGGPPSDWAQLISALGVLGQASRAAEIGAEAEAAFAADPDALRLIRLAVRDAVQNAAGQVPE